MVSQFAARPAHPRSRGENAWKLKGKAIVSGSSPLTRGKHAARPERQRPGGLIPAHAGKTLEVWMNGIKGRAHPRSRGENVNKLTVAGGAKGSSPLTRGKPLRLPTARSARGLIPAHAGKTAYTTWPAR